MKTFLRRSYHQILFRQPAPLEFSSYKNLMSCFLFYSVPAKHIFLLAYRFPLFSLPHCYPHLFLGGDFSYFHHHYSEALLLLLCNAKAVWVVTRPRGVMPTQGNSPLTSPS